ncbi:transcription factor, MADS-box [Tanacetum coccineum]|uniref:Transcription factor, MADS-box n=1 Tax=Tanacetum coccineum TaxID=301880 RepID=A0ABQ5GRT5_9ASTR
MGRGKVRMELINNEKKRKRAFIIRKDCTFKKAFELATLCDVNVSMIISSDDQESPEIFPQDPCIINDMINVYKRNRVNGKIKSYGLLEFCKDGKDNIEGELAKTKKDNLEEVSNEVRFHGQVTQSFFLAPEIEGLSFRLGLKINQVKSRIKFLKSKKLDGRDSLRMPLNTPNPVTIMTCIDQNNNSFGSDHGVKSSEPSNATAANRYKPLMLMGQNLLGHDSDSMASTMTKDDDNSVSDGAIQPEVLQQLEQPQCLDLLSCFRT